MVYIKGFGKSDQTQKVQNTALLFPLLASVVYATSHGDCLSTWDIPQHHVADLCGSGWNEQLVMICWFEAKNGQHHNGSLHNNQIVPKKRPLN